MTNDLAARIADMRPKVEAWKTVKAADPRYWAVWKEYQDARLLDLFIEMADEIDRLRDERDQARAALEPFAKLVALVEKQHGSVLYRQEVKRDILLNAARVHAETGD